MKKNMAVFMAVFMAVVSSHAQGCATAPAGLVAWWQAEDNAYDSIGNNNGTLINGTSFTNGEVGQAFNLNGVNNFVLVNAGPNLTTGLQNGFTFESWINPTTVTSVVELFEYERALATGNGADVGVLFAIHNQAPDGTSGPCLYANIVDASSAHVIASPVGLLTAGSWQHVALTYDKASGLAAIYINGTNVAQANLGSFTPLTGFTNLLLGARTTFGSVANPPNAYSGLMDETGFYNRALSSNEIAGIYLAGSAGKCFTPAAPVILTQPQSQTNIIGGTVNFSVTASGTPPLSYQWKFGGTNIVNATNTILTLNNVQLSQAGNYSVTVTNIAGSTNSANAVLTVNVPLTCTTPPSGLVSWWRAEGNAYDSIGGNSGTSTSGVSYTNGEVGQAFNFNGTSTLTVADAPSLDPTNALTIEYWVYALARPAHTWSQNVFTKDGVTSSRQYLLTVGDSPTTSGAGDFRAVIGVTSGLKILDSLAVIQSNTWYHVAETYDGAALKLYVNGSLDSQMAVTGPIITTTQPVRIGGDAPAGPYYFNGRVDEISLYNRALTSNEIAAIYNAGSAGKCFTPVVPAITTQPTNQTILAGGTASFSVAASGTAPLSYQWQFGGTNILNATNALLTLTNVQLSQAGNYSVVVSNVAGSTNSVNALLTVNVPVCTPAPSGLVALWQAEGNAYDSIGNNNGTPVGGVSYTNGEVGQAFVFNDTSSYIPVPASPSLNLGTNGGFTIEGWIKPDAYTVSAANGAGAPIIEWDSATQDGLDLWVYNGSLLGGIRNTNGATTVTLQSSSGVFNTNSMQHVAFTYDKSSGLGVLYLNGVVVATNNYGSVTPQTASPVNIGRRTGEPYYVNATYGGLIDELSLYSRALSSNEIATIYNAGSGGKCFTPVAPAITTQPTNQTVLAGGTATFNVTASGTAPLGYQWKFGGTNILNATNTMLTLNNVQLSQAGSYSVMVSNIAGSTNSVNAVLTVNVPVPVPAIYAFNPVSGMAGTPLTITGTNFSAVAAGNVVYFGAVQATVASASATNLLVTVPVSATFAPITVTVNGLTAYASQPFMPTFAGDGSGIDTSSFAPLFNLQAGSSSPGKTVIADIDGDGKPDLIVACGGGVVSIYRNISTNGSMTAASFAPRVDLAPPSAGANPFDVEVADVDGDGKLDIVVSDFNTAQVSVYRNSCTPGNISSNLFTRVDFATGNEPQGIVVRDIDGDGKPDLLVANPGDDTVSVLRNTSIVGSLTTNSFAPKVDIATGGSCNSIAVGDLDGDGKPDMVVGCASNGNVALFRNISSPGSFTSNSFAPQVNLSGVSYTINLQIADMDGDGKLDLVAVSYLSQAFSVFRNISTVGSLTTNSFAPRIDYSLGGRGHTAAIADLDGDGKPDLAIVTELNSLFSVFRNTSTPGSFTNSSLAGRVDFPTGYNPSGVSVGDLDGDGRPDVVFGNVYDNTISIYQNTVPFAGPPVITTQPTNQTVTVGQTATFSVAAGGSQPLSYQWQFGGTNILNATNSLLTLTNVQVCQAGNYSITVTNALGSTNSANAVLTVMLPPVITQQPQSQSVVTYGTASFTVAATGTGPLSYQWQFNGTNLVDGGNVSGSATTNLILTGVNSSEAGNYNVVVSNPYAVTNSSVAILTVPQTVMTLVSTNAMSGSTLVVPVLMNAVGKENAFQASVGYDPTKLVLQSVQPGPAAAGAYLQEVDGPPNSGQVGFVILLNTGSTQPVGTNEEVADLVFSTLPVTNNVTVNLAFGDNPIARGVSDNNGNSLPTIYQNGAVALAPAEYEADVYPRPTGDHQVGLSDWVEVGRMVAGLDTPTNSDEMLRADCAPRNAPDGILTVADWVQAGRYELKLDPLTLVTPPPAPSLLSLKSSQSTQSPTRTLQIGTVSVGRGQTVNVPVLLVCTTNENAVGMTIGYDVSRLEFLNATLGSAIIGGRINVNTNHAPGEVGVALAMSPGLALAAGTNQVAVLQFAAMTNASGPAVLSLDGTVVKLQLADKTANVLAASYVNGAVNLPPQPVVTTAVTGTNLQLTWQVASGTFQVESASSPVGPWATNTASALSFVTNGANVTVTVTATNAQQYFRLIGQ